MREWEYWPFNAGAQKVAKEGGDENKASIEILLQNSLRLEKQPAVHFVKMSVDKNGGALGWMKSWFKEKGGDLSAYKDFSLLGFDNFGAAFSHLRKTMPKSRKDKQNENACSGINVNDCPVDVLKQDGHHLSASYVGYDTTNPMMKAKADESGFNRLFINWHPAPLGHEVIGNQVAFYHLKVSAPSLHPSSRAVLVRCAVLICVLSVLSIAHGSSTWQSYCWRGRCRS
jgi:hypothetical protein